MGNEASTTNKRNDNLETPYSPTGKENLTPVRNTNKGDENTYNNTDTQRTETLTSHYAFCLFARFIRIPICPVHNDHT